MTATSCTYDNPADKLAATARRLTSARRSRPARPATPTATTSAARRSASLERARRATRSFDADDARRQPDRRPRPAGPGLRPGHADDHLGRHGREHHLDDDAGAGAALGGRRRRRRGQRDRDDELHVDVGPRQLGQRREVLDGSYQITAPAVRRSQHRRRGQARERRAQPPPALCRRRRSHGGHNTRAGRLGRARVGACNQRARRPRLPRLLGGHDGITGTPTTCWSARRRARAACSTRRRATASTSIRPIGATKYHIVAVDRDAPTPCARATRVRSPSAPRARGRTRRSARASRRSAACRRLSGCRRRRATRASTGSTATASATTARTPGSPTYTDSSPGSGGHQYWITAVDSTFNESDIMGPVSWSPDEARGRGRLDAHRAADRDDRLAAPARRDADDVRDFVTGVDDNDARNDTAELARNALDIQARQLRNLAKRVSSPVIDTLTPDDLIFQTADPQRTWVRYCLDTTTPPPATARGRLWTGELVVASAATASPVTAAMRASCPGTRLDDDARRRRLRHQPQRGHARPLFEYTCMPGTTCTATAATYDQVVDIGAQAMVDTTPGTGRPRCASSAASTCETRTRRRSRASSRRRRSTSRTVVLNAAGSTDYEGRTLDYYWFKTVIAADGASIDCAQSDGHRQRAAADAVGRGWASSAAAITLTHTFPRSTASRARRATSASSSAIPATATRPPASRRRPRSPSRSRHEMTSRRPDLRDERARCSSSRSRCWRHADDRRWPRTRSSTRRSSARSSSASARRR